MYELAGWRGGATSDTARRPRIDERDEQDGHRQPEDVGVHGPLKREVKEQREGDRRAPRGPEQKKGRQRDLEGRDPYGRGHAKPGRREERVAKRAADPAGVHVLRE